MKQPSSASRRAAEMYLAGRGDGITMRECAGRYGVSVGTVHAVVARVRKERSEAADLWSSPEDECSL